VLGIGLNGHLGFNEPLSSFQSRTQVQTLSRSTRLQNRTLFPKSRQIPFQAITMGIGTILDARQCLLLATGVEKAEIVAKAVEGPMTAMVTATALQLHPHSTVVLDDAAASYRAAIAADPGAADPHYNLALTLLLGGHYREGWAEMEWRWKTGAFQKQAQHFSVPAWTGDDAEGGVVLLHDEQGLGDTIQFCRFVTLAAQRARVVLQVQRPLLRLMSGLRGPEAIIARGDKPPGFARHLPLMSLPHVLGTEIPSALGYLQAPADRVAHWQARLSGLPGLRIGLVWAGNPRLGGTSYDRADQRRSVRLEQFRPLAMPGVSLVSLQKGAAAQQTAGFPISDWTTDLSDMAETAALVSALDLVISVDTAVAHLAGALGRPVWLLNRFDCDWRWGVTGEESIWYKSLRQFRQPSRGDWATPIAQMITALVADNTSQKFQMRGKD